MTESKKLTKEEKKAIKKAKKAEMKAKGQSFWADFKKFIAKGNVIDMAVGVVIGAAFKEIINAFVDKIINPLVGLAVGNVQLSDLSIVLKEAVTELDGTVTPAITLGYGLFLQRILDFLIIAFCIFLAVRIIRSAKVRLAIATERLAALAKKEEEVVEVEPATEPAPAPAPVKTTDERIEEILIEIRDSLKSKPRTAKKEKEAE